MEKYKLTIVIDGVSADDLFAVGPNDLKNYFLPEMLNVNPEDIKQISFTSDLTGDEFAQVMIGERQRYGHVNNFYRDKQ